MNSKKNAIVVIVALIAVGAGIYSIAVQEKPAGSGSANPSLSTTVVPGNRVEFPPYSLVPKLSGDVFMAFALSPANFEPLVSHLTMLKTRLASTQLWKKYNVDAVLSQVGISEVGHAPGAASPARNSDIPGGLPDTGLEVLSSGPFRLVTTLSSVLPGIQELAVFVSARTVSISDAVNVPQFMLALSAASPEHAMKLVNLVEVLLHQARVFNPALANLKFEKADTQNSWSLAMPIEGIKDGLRGSLKAQASYVLATFGSDDPLVFLSPDKNARLANGARWGVIQSALLPGANSFVFFDYALFGPLMGKTLFATVGQSTKNVGAQLTQAWNDIELMSSSSAFDRGLKVRQCARVKLDSPLLSQYQKFVHAQGEVPRSTSFSFHKLVVPNTMLAFRASRSTVEFLLEYLRQLYERTGAGSASAQTEWKEFNKKFGTIVENLKKVPFQEVGIVVNAPSAGPFPEIGFFMGADQDLIIRDVAALINATIAVIGEGTGLPQLPQAQVLQSVQGGERLEFVSSDGQRYSASLVTPRALLGSNSQAMVEAAGALLAQPSSYLQNQEVQDNKFLETLPSSEYLFVLNTRGVIEMAKPFLPLLMMQQPGIQLTQPEIDEVLGVLKGGVMVISSSQMADQTSICTDSKAVIF